MTDPMHGDHPLVVKGPAIPAEHLRSPNAHSPDSILLTMSADGAVTVYSGKVDYGQGIRGGFALAVAEELDLAPEKVQVVLGDTDLVPYDRATVGSASTRTVGLQLLRAAATARDALLDLASGHLGMSKDQLVAEDGTVRDAARGAAEVAYQDLLRDQRLTLSVAEDIKAKDPAGFQVAAGPIRQLDAVEKVTGRAKYSRDVTLPGMLYGKILRPPSYGAVLERLDASRSERIPGVVSIVREGDFVGVVAEREDIAEYALEVLRASWREDRDTASDWNLPALLKERSGEAVVLREEGAVEAGFEQADQVHEGIYYAPYVANAQMEPSAGVASWEDGRLTVWCGNRSPFGERDFLANAFEIPPESVRVLAPHIGGSFGTKTSTVGYEAARLARAVNRPVRVTYSRTEEFGWSTVRPAALIEVRSGVTADGRIVAWDYTAYHANENPFRGRRGADTPYDTENVHVAVASSESPLRSGSYRSLGGAVNHFAREVHIDRIARSMGIDPLELRLRNLDHPRLRRVLETAADRFGWSARNAQAGEGFGLAVGYDAGSYAAECVRISVQGRDVGVKDVLAAFDCGVVLNPEGVRNQVEGSIVMGIGTALWEAVEFDGGRILNAGFSRYRVPRIGDAPEIDVELIDDPSNPATGAGEPGLVPIAAAVANAVRDATGQRIEQLPLVPHLT